MGTPDAEPLTTAELDALDALNRARTPGPLRASGVTVSVDAGACAMGRIVAMCSTTDDARAIAAALNALPALLAEVRASRARSPFGLAPESYTLEPASPEMRERYGAARGKASK